MEVSSMRVLLIDESYPLNTRNVKILHTLEDSFVDADINILTWDRIGNFDGGIANWHYHLYKRHSAYGKKIHKLIGLFGYKKFCHQVIGSISPDVIIASHWNNLLMLPAVDYKKQMVIYDNLDSPTGPWVARRILNLIEHYYMKRIALTVHASRFYTRLYPEKYRQIVLENKPYLEVINCPYRPCNPLRIVYLGVIRYIDILKNLVEAVRGNENMQLVFHGNGPGLQELLDYTRDVPNVSCTGAYHYENLGSLYNEADVVWAAYPNHDFNVRYAISNKFHESIAYGRPAIYADRTMLGQYAVDNHLGLMVDPYSLDSVKLLLETLSADVGTLMSIHDSLCAYREKESSWKHDADFLLQYIRCFMETI